VTDVDLYLFDCTGKRCRPAGSALGLGSPPRLRRANPKPGLWKVVLDGNQLPEGGATVEYTDVVADPSLGVVAVADGSRRREPAARWTVKANVWLAKRPEMDRVPQALFLVNATKDGSTVSVALRRVPMEVRAASKQP
jgi:hypothetical protein